MFNEYLKILDTPERRPDLTYLIELIGKHLQKVPFENISKVYYKRKYGSTAIPDFELYIEGIKRNNFGGTCYSTNYYFNQLLNYLGFNAIISGADMANPDVHLVSIVKLDGREFIVDVGYAAPFFEPLPIDLDYQYAFEFGYDKYILLPKDKSGRSQLKLYRYNALAHSYIVNPYPRRISEFSEVIKASYNSSATFMNSILLTRFSRDSSTIIRDLSIIDIENGMPNKRILWNKAELVSEIFKNFKMPHEIISEVIEAVYPVEPEKSDLNIQN